MKTIPYDVVYFRLLTATVLAGLLLAAANSFAPANSSLANGAWGTATVNTFAPTNNPPPS